jgi:hypothetical protein
MDDWACEIYVVSCVAPAGEHITIEQSDGTLICRYWMLRKALQGYTMKDVDNNREIVDTPVRSRGKCAPPQTPPSKHPFPRDVKRRSPLDNFRAFAEQHVFHFAHGALPAFNATTDTSLQDFL